MTDFFYDGQIRRFLLQFIRIMSNFQVEYGRDSTGAVTLQRVPVKYGDSSRQASSILNNVSENTIAGVVPMIAVYISDLKYNRPWMQEPNFVSKINIRQREYDPATGVYSQAPGNAFTVERHMPVPYILGLKVDIWTSNTTQKLQMIEQVAAIFNPSIEIQSTDNYVDWTSLSTIEMTDINFSSRSIPVGTDEPIDIATLSFELPIWISMPAKVKRLGVIHKIVNSIYDAGGDIDESIFNQDLLMGTRQYLSPLNYGVILLDGMLRLVKYNEPVLPAKGKIEPNFKVGTADDWRTLLQLYGELTNGISQVRLSNDETGIEIMGTVTLNPNDNTTLGFAVDVDTIPTNTLAPIDAIIDPQRGGPGVRLPQAATGTRYLLLGDIGDTDNQDGAAAWKGTGGEDLVADMFDIVEYNGDIWQVVFDASETVSTEYTTNLSTGIQYAWGGAVWQKSYEGEYTGGKWSLIL
jgi:hypothetical protein